MTNEWAPSVWGRKLTGSTNWRLSLKGAELSLTVNGLIHRINVEGENTCRIRPGILWATMTFRSVEPREITVDGLPNHQAELLTRALAAILKGKCLREDVDFVRQTADTLACWLADKTRQEQQAEADRRWFTHEMQSALETARPQINETALRLLLQNPDVRSTLGAEADRIDQIQRQWSADHRAGWAEFNARHTERELVACKPLFDAVEKLPLSVEQAKAVICFDNRVQVIASAGSGKTSTMVARAAYAIQRHIVPPQGIVLLAFNKKAAEELKERCAVAFARLGLTDVTVEASTFHALGLGIIGKATGSKPDIPEWAVDTGSGLCKLHAIVEQLKADSLGFALQWQLFRLVFAGDLPAFGASDTANAWDAQGHGLILTLDGKLVRSQEEAAICNWLFFNSVNYCYEAHYEFATADDEHRQYRPDFYYPDIKLYHEHFALDAEGNAPAHFTDYLAGVEWKRQLHKERKTALIETTSWQLRSGAAFQHLEKELTTRGIQLKPDPDRELPTDGQTPMAAAELVGLIRIFIGHAKSNALKIDAIRQQLNASGGHFFAYRHRLFLDLVEPVLHAWDAALAAEGGIDFEDMLNMAAEHLEQGRYVAPFELVMADEFQDASRARARLCRALVQQPDRYLFAVGDDWQSINRFAGADLSVMTHFREWFGHGQILRLEQTFRCPQALCDISSRFVAKNPNQLSKRVHSCAPALAPAVRAFQVERQEKLYEAIKAFLLTLVSGLQDGSIPPGRDGRLSVYVLGRYNADRQYMPGRQEQFANWLDISFSTIHSAKGSEADYIILPAMVSTTKGRSFPDTRSDDPVLTLAMPEGDGFPLGEERRLFYVALTRAKRSVAMFTVRGRCSTFLRELSDEGAVSIVDINGQEIAEEPCPFCRQGVVTIRRGRNGEFFGCSNYPSCKYTARKSPFSASPARAPRNTARPASAMNGASQTRAPQPSAPPAPMTAARKTQPVAAPQPVAARDKQPSAPPQPIATTSSTPPTEKKTTASRLRFGMVMTQAMEEQQQKLAQVMARERAVQDAVAELTRNLSAEREAIDTALHHARALPAAAAQTRTLFAQNVAQLDALLSKAGPPVQHPLPDFARAEAHDDGETELVIRQKLAQLKQEREAFLSAIRRQLDNDSSLCAGFIADLRKRQGERYLAALAPQAAREQQIAR